LRSPRRSPHAVGPETCQSLRAKHEELFEQVVWYDYNPSGSRDALVRETNAVRTEMLTLGCDLSGVRKLRDP
jgi:hypothetical protein